MEVQVDFEFIDRYVLLYNKRLFWKERVPEDFKSNHNSRELSCKSWNTRYSGTPALDCLDKTHGYKSGSIKGKKIYAHVALWALSNKEMPLEEIDHINGIRSDNRIENLRSVSRLENTRNKRLREDNPFKRHGISFIQKSGKYRVRKQKRHVGMYETLEEAIAACDKIETEYGFHPNHGKS